MASTNKQYIKNIGIISVGPLIATILGFLAEPWISRAWGPMVFGIGAYYTSIITMVSGLMFLRYDFAIVQAKTRREAHSLLALCIIVMLLMLVIVAPLYKYIGKLAQDDFPFERYGAIMFLSAAFASLATLLRFWYSGKKKFIAISGSLILSSVSNTSLLLVYGALGKVSEGNMIFIRVFSNILVTIVLIIPYFRKDLWITLRCVSVKSIASAAKMFRRYPLYEYWGYAANLASLTIPVILITRYWGQDTTGLYAKALSILQMMVLFIGNSVNRVLHKEAADIINRKESPARLLSQTCRGLIKFSIFPTLFLVLLAPELFSVLLGSQWRLSGVFSQYLSVWTFTAILSNAMLPMFGILNKQLQLSVFTISTLIVRVIILVYMGRIGSHIVVATAVFALGNFIVLGIKSGYILAIGGVNLKTMGMYLGGLLVKMSPYVVAILFVKTILKLNGLLSLIVGGVLALPYIYYFYLKDSGLVSMMIKKGKNILKIA
ncbi:MAG: oligosaccharide flippase family protein [Candidatus Cloacimonetes bacterium]|nr:oligosaccharide flippase family protein [Candidatus Cloacimonadota bacterium]